MSISSEIASGTSDATSVTKQMSSVSNGSGSTSLSRSSQKQDNALPSSASVIADIYEKQNLEETRIRSESISSNSSYANQSWGLAPPKTKTVSYQSGRSPLPPTPISGNTTIIETKSTVPVKVTAQKRRILQQIIAKGKTEGEGQTSEARRSTVTDDGSHERHRSNSNMKILREIDKAEGKQLVRRMNAAVSGSHITALTKASSSDLLGDGVANVKSSGGGADALSGAPTPILSSLSIKEQQKQVEHELFRRSLGFISTSSHPPTPHRAGCISSSSSSSSIQPRSNHRLTRNLASVALHLNLTRSPGKVLSVASPDRVARTRAARRAPSSRSPSPQAYYPRRSTSSSSSAGSSTGYTGSVRRSHSMEWNGNATNPLSSVNDGGEDATLSSLYHKYRIKTPQENYYTDAIRKTGGSTTGNSSVATTGRTISVGSGTTNVSDYAAVGHHRHQSPTHGRSPASQTTRFYSFYDTHGGAHDGGNGATSDDEDIRRLHTISRNSQADLARMDDRSYTQTPGHVASDVMITDTSYLLPTSAGDGRDLLNDEKHTAELKERDSVIKELKSQLSAAEALFRESKYQVQGLIDERNTLFEQQRHRNSSRWMPIVPTTVTPHVVENMTDEMRLAGDLQSEEAEGRVAVLAGYIAEHTELGTRELTERVKVVTASATLIDAKGEETVRNTKSGNFNRTGSMVVGAPSMGNISTLGDKLEALFSDHGVEPTPLLQQEISRAVSAAYTDGNTKSGNFNRTGSMVVGAPSMGNISTLGDKLEALFSDHGLDASPEVKREISRAVSVALTEGINANDRNMESGRFNRTGSVVVGANVNEPPQLPPIQINEQEQKVLANVFGEGFERRKQQKQDQEQQSHEQERYSHSSERTHMPPQPSQHMQSMGNISTLGDKLEALFSDHGIEPTPLLQQEISRAVSAAHTDGNTKSGNFNRTGSMVVGAPSMGNISTLGDKLEALFSDHGLDASPEVKREISRAVSVAYSEAETSLKSESTSQSDRDTPSLKVMDSLFIHRQRPSSSLTTVDSIALGHNKQPRAARAAGKQKHSITEETIHGSPVHPSGRQPVVTFMSNAHKAAAQPSMGNISTLGKKLETLLSDHGVEPTAVLQQEISRVVPLRDDDSDEGIYRRISARNSSMYNMPVDDELYKWVNPRSKSLSSNATDSTLESESRSTRSLTPTTSSSLNSSSFALPPEPQQTQTHHSISSSVALLQPTSTSAFKNSSSSSSQVVIERTGSQSTGSYLLDRLQNGAYTGGNSSSRADIANSTSSPSISRSSTRSRSGHQHNVISPRPRLRPPLMSPSQVSVPALMSPVAAMTNAELLGVSNAGSGQYVSPKNASPTPPFSRSGSMQHLDATHSETRGRENSASMVVGAPSMGNISTLGDKLEALFSDHGVEPTPLLQQEISRAVSAAHTDGNAKSGNFNRTGSMVVGAPSMGNISTLGDKLGALFSDHGLDASPEVKREISRAVSAAYTDGNTRNGSFAHSGKIASVPSMRNPEISRAVSAAHTDGTGNFNRTSSMVVGAPSTGTISTLGDKLEALFSDHGVEPTPLLQQEISRAVSAAYTDGNTKSGNFNRTSSMVVGAPSMGNISTLGDKLEALFSDHGLDASPEVKREISRALSAALVPSRSVIHKSGARAAHSGTQIPPSQYYSCDRITQASTTSFSPSPEPRSLPPPIRTPQPSFSVSHSHIRNRGDGSGSYLLDRVASERLSRSQQSRSFSESLTASSKFNNSVDYKQWCYKRKINPFKSSGVFQQESLRRL